MPLDTPRRGNASPLPAHAPTMRLDIAPEVLFARSRTTVLVGQRKRAVAPIVVANSGPQTPALDLLPQTKRNSFEPAPGARHGTVVGLGSVAELMALAALPSVAPAAPSAPETVRPTTAPIQPEPSRRVQSLLVPSTPVPRAPVPSAPVVVPAEPALFRKVAVDARHFEGQGTELGVRVEPRSWGLLALLASLVALLFVGASLASVEVTAQAQGMLRAPRGLRPVASVNGGSLSEVLVESGDLVQVGQVIARLEATDLRAALVNRERELATTQADVTSAEERDRRVEERASGALRRRRSALQDRIEINGERLVQRRTQVRNYEELIREGGASQNEGLTAKESLQTATESVSQLSAEVAQLDLELADRARQAEERRSARQLQASRAQANVEEAQTLLAATEIRAPAAGQIESLSVSAGSVVEPGGLLGNVVPSGAPRTIVAFIPSREMAFVAPAASATVEVQSLPVSEFGLGAATVTRVSSDLATAAEVQATLGEAPSTPVVRVELELVSSAAGARLEAQLRSGERVTVRLHRRQRRLITLLFDFVRRWTA